MQQSPDSLLARLPNEDKLRPSGHRSAVPGPLSVLLSEHGKEWGPFLCPTNTLRNDLEGGRSTPKGSASRALCGPGLALPGRTSPGLWSPLATHPRRSPP